MKRFLAVGLTAWSLCFGSVAGAGGTNKARAKKIFATAHSYFKQKKFDEAIRLFKQAHRLWPHRSIRYNIALAYAMKGDKIRAVTVLRKYLKDATAREQKLPEVLKRAQRQVGVLVVQVARPDARIYVDGRLAGKQKVEVVVSPGRRAVVVRIGDRVVARKTIDVPAGKERLWKPAAIVVPKPRPAPGPPKEPEHKPAPPVEPAPTPLPPARVELRPLTAQVTPPARPHTQVPRHKPRRLARLHWAYFAVGASLAAATAVAAVATSVKTKQIHDRWVNEGRDRNSALKTKGMKYQDTANALWGIAGAFAVGSAILAVFTRWRSRAQEREVSAAPLLFPAGGGLSVQWKH